MEYPSCSLFSGPGGYLIRLRSGQLRCRGFGGGVRQEIPSCGHGDLYESSGRDLTMEIDERGVRACGKVFAVARRSKIADTYKLETIE